MSTEIIQVYGNNVLITDINTLKSALSKDEVSTGEVKQVREYLDEAGSKPPDLPSRIRAGRIGIIGHGHIDSTAIAHLVHKHDLSILIMGSDAEMETDRSLAPIKKFAIENHAHMIPELTSIAVDKKYHGEDKPWYDRYTNRKKKKRKH